MLGLFHLEKGRFEEPDYRLCNLQSEKVTLRLIGKVRCVFTGESMKL